MKKTTIAIALCALAIGLSGCGAATNTVKTKSKEQHILNDAAGQDARKADELSAKVARVNGVQKATVIVNRNDAVIGIDVNAGTNPATVEKEVKTTAEHALPGHRVHVTSDRNIHARIQTLHGQMRPLDGHPVRNFARDVATIIQDVGRAAAAPFR